MSKEAREPAKLAENQVAVDAELDDAIIRGRAEHGEEGTDAPVGRGRPLVLLPIHEEASTGDTFRSVREYF